MDPIEVPVHNAAEIETVITSFAREANGRLLVMSDAFTVDIINWLIDRKFDRSALADDGELLGTHIQIDEINPTEDEDRVKGWELTGASSMSPRETRETVCWRLPCGRY